MKKTLLSICAMFLMVASTFAVNSGNWKVKVQEEVGALDQGMIKMNLDDFMNLTPGQYKKATGKKLGLKNTLKLKTAQKFLKSNLNAGEAGGADIPKGLYIVGIILGWGWLLMGLMDDFSGNNWWVNLILTALCWLPGVIHGFIKMNDYY